MTFNQVVWASRVESIQALVLKLIKTPSLFRTFFESGNFLNWFPAYLPGTGVNSDPEGCSPRARPFHCTPVGLTLAIAPNVGDSGAQFLVVGDCVRALP